MSATTADFSVVIAATYNATATHAEKLRRQAQPGYIVPRTDKVPSTFLSNWLHDDAKHGYEFDEEVLFGREPDTDYLGGFINKPNNWEEVVKCLQSEIGGQKRLSRSTRFRSAVDKPYWLGCKKALKEVLRYYL